MNPNLFQNHFFVIFPELFLISGITFILLFGLQVWPFLDTQKSQSPQPTVNHRNIMWPVGWLSIWLLFITLLLNFNIPLSLESLPLRHLVDPISPTAGAWMSPAMNDASLFSPESKTQTLMGMATLFNNTLIFDHFTCLIKSIILLCALFTILISFAFIQSVKINSWEYFILILFSTFSMLLIVSSYDMISMYLAIELQSLAFYVLAAYQRNSEFSTEAGLKYFILGALSSGLLLLGQSLVYGFTGITQFEELGKLFLFFIPSGQDSSLPFLGGAEMLLASPLGVSDSLALLGLLFILFAFLFKISAVPFHMWTPDVYEGSPTSVTAFFSITPKIAIFALLLRLCLFSFYNLMPAWQSIILISALLSMFIGTFGALNQNKIKRLFAYSSIAHVGFLLIGLGTGTIEAVESIFIYLIIYIITILNVFGILLVLSWAKPSSPAGPSIAFRATSPALSHHSAQHPPAETGTLVGSLSSLPYVFSLEKDPESHGVQTNQIEPNKYLISSLPLLRDSLLTEPQTYSHSLSQSKRRTLSSFLSFPFGLAFTGSTSHLPGHIKFMSDLSPLVRSNPLLAFTFAIILFSNAGVPPLAGFYGKLNILIAAVESSMYFIAIAAIISSVIGAFYSIRLVKILYFHRISQTSWPQWKPIARENALVLACSFFFTLFFFLNPSFLFIAAHNAALAICI